MLWHFQVLHFCSQRSKCVTKHFKKWEENEIKQKDRIQQLREQLSDANPDIKDMQEYQMLLIGAIGLGRGYLIHKLV